MNTISRVLLALAALISISLPATAGAAHQFAPVTQFCDDRVYGGAVAMEFHGKSNVGARRRATITSDVTVVGGRDPACRVVGHLSCGCDTAIYLGIRNHLYPNGKSDLDLASNFRFLKQSAIPCAPCAAWRNGHVMAVMAVGPNGITVRDANSGHGMTRVYTVASLPGYRFAIPGDLNLSGRHVAIWRSPHAHNRMARNHHHKIRLARR